MLVVSSKRHPTRHTVDPGERKHGVLYRRFNRKDLYKKYKDFDPQTSRFRRLWDLEAVSNLASLVLRSLSLCSSQWLSLVFPWSFPAALPLRCICPPGTIFNRSLTRTLPQDFENVVVHPEGGMWCAWRSGLRPASTSPRAVLTSLAAGSMAPHARLCLHAFLVAACCVKGFVVPATTPNKVGTLRSRGGCAQGYTRRIASKSTLRWSPCRPRPDTRRRALGPDGNEIDILRHREAYSYPEYWEDFYAG